MQTATLAPNCFPELAYGGEELIYVRLVPLDQSVKPSVYGGPFTTHGEALDFAAFAGAKRGQVFDSSSARYVESR